MENDEIKVVQTDVGAKDGQNKCPKCGATDISVNTNNGKLRCNFCRCEFDAEKVAGMVEDISQLSGQVMGSGAQNIIADTSDTVTLKCTSCGAEVVIDTASSMNARCHWCRNTLSVNQQIPNGSVPDVVLPFKLRREEAQQEIEKFVGKRKFFAHPKFRQEFTTQNIMGVYFPYMVVDVNAHSRLSGEGEHLTKVHHHGNNNPDTYDADAYYVEREFDLTINGLTVESNSDRLNTTAKDKTNNIINSIMPFDIENSVKYNSNYLKGFTSEKRDTNVDDLRGIVNAQSKDIARFAANDTLAFYDRGVAWRNEVFDIKGQQWKAAYLPVWLYSYQEKKGNSSLLHYVAVNARTKETMGSVPIHMPKLIGVSVITEILGIFLLFILMILFSGSDDGMPSICYLLFFTGFIFYAIQYSRYRNKGARHNYETETTKHTANMRKVDNFTEHRRNLRNTTVNGCNNKLITGNAQGAAKSIGQKILQQSSAYNAVMGVTNAVNNQAQAPKTPQAPAQNQTLNNQAQAPMQNQAQQPGPRQ